MDGKKAKGPRGMANELGLIPNLGGISLAEVGLALNLLAPRSEPAAPVENFVLRHSGLERRSPLSALVLPHSG